MKRDIYCVLLIHCTGGKLMPGSVVFLLEGNIGKKKEKIRMDLYVFVLKGHMSAVMTEGKSFC